MNLFKSIWLAGVGFWFGWIAHSTFCLVRDLRRIEREQVSGCAPEDLIPFPGRETSTDGNP